MFNAKVYKVMVGSLSGTMEEVYAAKETIRKWNLENAERLGKLFLPMEWSSKSEDIKEVDVVIGIVGNWIEKTDIVKDRQEEGKAVLLFFNAFHDPKNTIQSERESVQSFYNNMNNHCYCAVYKSTHELNVQIAERLMTIE